MRASSLCILNIAYPLAPVGPDAVGGAEQIVQQLDAALVRAGDRSIVVAREDSQVQGVLIPLPIFDPEHADRDAVRATVSRAIEYTLASFPVDLIHLHGVDFDGYLPSDGPPALVTLHLPAHAYARSAFEIRRQKVYFNCVSHTQHAALPPTSVPVLDPISNGVALNDLQPQSGPHDFALALGRICPEKGFHLAAEAARIAHVPLLLGGQVFGYADHQAYFDEVLAPMLDEQWFRFVGPLSFARKRQLLARARCVVVPSQTPETSSLVAMEAAACGTPVIAFNAGALTETVDHGRSGYLVSSVEEMADAIRAVDRLDRQECRRVAEERFSADAMANSYLERYAHIVSRGTTSRELRIDEVTSIAGLEALRTEWTALWQRCGTSVFQHPDWLTPWCRPFHVREPWLLTFRRGGALVGVAPMLVYPRDGQRILTLMGAGISDDQDVVVEAAERAVVMRSLWDHLARHADRWDVLELENLRSDSPLLGTPPHGWHVAPPQQVDVRPVVLLRGATRLEDLDATDAVRDVRYQMRRLEREGLPIHYEQATPSTFERLFDVLVRLHRARWTERGEPGMLEGDLEAFHREAAQRFLEQEALRLHVAWLGNRAAAAFYGFHTAGKTIYYLGGFDPVLARYSPGKLIVAYAIEHAIVADRADAFDFLRGREAYKYQWGAVDEPIFNRHLCLENSLDHAHAA